MVISDEDFVHLHTHTEYSNLRFRDSINKVKDMILHVDGLGNRAMAVSDHESISSHIKFLNAVKELKSKNKIHKDFKPILGNEIYLVDEEIMYEEMKGLGKTKFYHFLVLAKDNIGHEQLRKLSTTAWKRMFNFKGVERVPTFYSDMESIVGENKGHLIVSSACLGGKLPNLILSLLQEENEDIKEQIKDELDDFINWCLDLFGEDFYVELQPSLQQEQIDFNVMAVKIAKAYNLKWIVTTDAHYLTAKDREIHKAFLTSEDDLNNNREVDTFYSTTHFFTVDEIFKNMNYLDTGDIEKAILNTKEITDKIIGYDFFAESIIPLAKLPNKSEWYSIDVKILNKYQYIKELYEDKEEQHTYLIAQTFKGITEREIKAEKLDGVLERINIECKEITGASKAKNQPMGAYLITMQKNVDIIWEEAESFVGPGRGSANGYIINYLLGITQVNPLEQGVEMPHWRFMSAERPDIFDIDIDYSSHKKDVVMDKVVKYYQSIGGDAIRVCTFGTETSKSAIQTACFKKGTQINTLNGIKSIEYIKKGDYVETANGWEEIITPTFTENKTLINLKTRNSSESFISCTEEHEFLMINKYHKGRMNGIFVKDKVDKYYPEILDLKSTDKNYQKLYGYCREVTPNWVCAKDITINDYGLKRIDLKTENSEFIYWKNEAIKNYDCGISTKIKINEEFCELIGIWLAEGSSNRNRITFTIHQEEEVFKNRIISLMWNVFQLDNYYIQPRKDTKALNITYSSRQIFNFFSQIFEVEKISEVNQWNKYIPNKLKFINPSLQLQIFKGWFVGDGYARRGTESKVTTVSKQLCEDMILVLNRNLINPYIIKEKKVGKCRVYNLMLYGEKAKKLSKIKYCSNLQNELKFTLDDFTEMDFPIFWNGKVYLKTKVEKMGNSEENLIKQRVYCLKIPSENFTVNGTIVHNCRGLHINNDVALYLSSLVPVERGKVWSIHDCFYGDKDNGRKHVTEFRNMVSEYTEKNLLNVILGIEGLINKRSSHACGILILNEEITKHNSVMRSPSGELISAYELHDSEQVSNLKYDFLNTKTESMLQLTMEMLVKNEKIEWQGSLRQTYNKYLHPDVIDFKSKGMWDILCRGEMLSAFQFESSVGEQAIKLIQPQNLIDAANGNTVMRLMVENGEQPLEKFVRYKNDIAEWYKDMKKFGLNKEQVSMLEKHLLQDNGVCSSQERMMLLTMDKDVAGFGVIESNKLRKGVAKKQQKLINEAKTMFFEWGEKANAPKILLEYIWNEQIALQLGYSFSILHAVAYTIILIQQLNLVYYYPPIYWNTAVLMVESGAVDREVCEDSDIEAKERTTNYGEIAKAIGKLQAKGINISLPYINKAEQGFLPNEEGNEIIFGFKGIMKINNDTAQTIMRNRPYINLEDFHKRLVLVKREVILKTGKIQMKSLVTEAQTIMLIKAGAFDKIERKEREQILEDYIRLLNPSKHKLNSKDISKIAEMGLIPTNLKDEMKFYNFREYLMSMSKKQDEQTKTIMWYKIHDEENENDTDYANNFFMVHFANEMEENRDYKYDEEGYLLVALGTPRKGSFESIYKAKISQLNKWINTEECINTYTDIVFQNIKNESMSGTISSWEMESMNYYYNPHELIDIDKEKYGVVDFKDLPEDPVVIGFTKYKGLQYPKFQLNRIVGTVLDRDKNKHSVTILTPDGVVVLKFYSGQFSFYDKTISKDVGVADEDGKVKKIVLENGWFQRGALIMVTGFRRGDIFKPKRYKNSIYQHALSKIVEVKEDNELILQNDRVQLVD